MQNYSSGGPRTHHPAATFTSPPLNTSSTRYHAHMGIRPTGDPAAQRILRATVAVAAAVRHHATGRVELAAVIAIFLARQRCRLDETVVFQIHQAI